MPEATASKIRLARIVATPIDPEILRAAIADPAGGAVALFVGLVRDHDGGRAVTALTYSAHPSATDRLHQVLSQHAERTGVLALGVEHRIGDLKVGDVAVVCGVTSAHRDVAFAVCADLIEQVKAEVPIWKEQLFTDGTNEWIGAS